MIRLEAGGIFAGFHPTGARIVSCVVDGVEIAVGAGPDNAILSGDVCAGAICGRHAGRIANARFPLDGPHVHLEPNMGKHQIHGGNAGFHARDWNHKQDGRRVTFTLNSADGEAGFPGNLFVSATYELFPDRLALTLQAETDATTICNLTNHGFWNLAGSSSVLEHELEIAGSRHYGVDADQIPTGWISGVDGTTWDFRRPRLIRSDYDGAIALDGEHGELKKALSLRDPASGRCLDMWTTQGTMQIYTAVHWARGLVSRFGPLARSQGLAIEPQNITDAENHAGFPSSILRPGEVYRNHMEWRFC
ncbi:galactose mutarotase-like enzyme [Rhizobium leguminosarum bv. trifolii WSM2012]|nr:galactose mutarotase-like enzyme [Rhizobium leguminosarum bv. trifolii WSM2012]EJC76922.1 galactose mutarotase-like enzyme [Rhizobium leguminosarum bv. trifolii WSM2012]